MWRQSHAAVADVEHGQEAQTFARGKAPNPSRKKRDQAQGYMGFLVETTPGSAVVKGKPDTARA
jgi:hypothetical protein